MRRHTLPVVIAVLVAVLVAAPVFAQSQAANGSIEGTVSDSSGGVLPGVTVTITNSDTGAQRVVVTNESGLYRALLLPLGTYRVVAELQGFKKYEESGVRLSAGQTAVVNVTLGVGTLSELVTVTASDKPVLDSAKIDAGRNLSEVEVKNLPLVARNPYNFALVQPGITGFENPEFGVPRLAANGTLMRINYQIDGNTNTEKDRAGLRLLPMSEVMVREVKVVTAGYAPEFGQTMGLVYNAITPSGTNQIHGDASYLFRRKNFSAFPFFFAKPETPENKPDTKVDTVTGTIGGPAIRNKLFYYVGYERTGRDLSAQRIITIPTDVVTALGLPPQPGAPPATQAAKFFIGKADYELNAANRLTGRYIMFRNDSPYNNGPGGITAMERATDFLDAMDSTAAQLVSTIGHSQLNELRVQYAHRHQSSSANDASASPPAISVSGVANFGGPYASAGQGSNGFDFKQNIWEVVDNFTYIRANHSYKFGFDGQWVHDGRTSAPVQSYTFPSINAYNAAKSGLDPYAYSSFTQLFGALSFTMDTKLYSAFVQDDWQLGPNLKMLYGVRYDVYDFPTARADAPFSYSQKFHIDKNNFGPRVGVAWTLDDRTVLRASTGIMYDQPILAPYENALQLTGSPRLVSVTVSPTSAGAPAFPGSLANTPPGFVLPTQSIVTVDPNFDIARTWQNNLQIERSIGTDYTVSAGYVFAKQNQLPVVNDINLINPVGTLADGRPIFSTAVNANTRMDPRFNHIYTVQSLGTGHYNALTLTLARRFSHGMTFNFSYTLGKGIDDAPINNSIPGGVGLAVNGDDPRSDPTNLQRDLGPNLLDVRHTFNGSVVLQPTIDVQNGVLRALLNHNEVGILMQFNSGLPFNIRANQDLNHDGQSNNDRPLFVGRNSMYLPNRYNVDLRYSRIVPIRGNVRAEVIGEFKNLFNTVQTASVNSVVATSALGNPLAPLPTDASGFPATGGYEQREFQLGFRLRF
jgi:hypothetical protein